MPEHKTGSVLGPADDRRLKTVDLHVDAYRDRQNLGRDLLKGERLARLAKAVSSSSLPSPRQTCPKMVFVNTFSVVGSSFARSYSAASLPHAALCNSDTRAFNR